MAQSRPAGSARPIQHSDWYTKWIEKEAEPREFLCDECGPTYDWAPVIEGTVCGATREVHIDQRRPSNQFRWIRWVLRDKLNQVPQDFRAVVRQALEKCGEETEQVMAEMAKELGLTNRPPPATAVIDYDRVEQIVRKVFTETAPVAQQVFNRAEAARFLRISPSELDKLRRLGLICKSGASRRVTFALEELLRYLRESSETRSP
jgi:hypothetical protein